LLKRLVPDANHRGAVELQQGHLVEWLDPAALARGLDVGNPELVPGSLPTTFQLSSDQGIGRLQGTLNQEPFQARAVEQNAARVGALQNLAPDANSGAVRDLLHQQLARLDAEGEVNVARAQQAAQQAFERAGGRLNAEDYGGLMRDQLEGAKAATKRQESALWQAIDPQGNLTISAVPVRQQAKDILQAAPSTARPPEGEEKAIFGVANLLPAQMPFGDFAALRSRLLGAIREEAANGQTPALRRMSQLRHAMDGAISDTAQSAAKNDPLLAQRLVSLPPPLWDSPPVPTLAERHLFLDPLHSMSSGETTDLLDRDLFHHRTASHDILLDGWEKMLTRGGNLMRLARIRRYREDRRQRMLPPPKAGG
jgi:hypothetical protein